MSLTASMWTGVSGMLAHGDKMNVIGNNIANVNTIGFKSQRMDFSDLMYVNEYNNGGLNQVGQGVSSQTIITSFSQGPYESTTNPTDLAISGSGFFQVRQPNSEQMYYTRAGNFTFNKDGYLEDPNNYILQGWEIDNSGGVTRASGGLSANTTENTSAIIGSGAPTDIKLDAWTIQPFATSEISFISKLSSDSSDLSPDPSNPFTGLVNIWDGTQPPANSNTPPIPQEAYSHQDTIEVYDEAGVKHKLTVYYDKVDSNSYEGGENGGSMWEYIVTMDPAEDMRQFAEVDPITGEVTLVDFSSTKNAGLLAAGTISFNSSGQATNQSTYTYLGSSTPTGDPNDYVEVWDEASGTNKEVAVGDPTELSNWQTAGISANGYPIVVPNFTGILDAQTSGSPRGEQYGIELSFGMKATNVSAPWSPAEGSLADLTVPPYEYNAQHSDGAPETGPQYYLVNEDYSNTANQAVVGATSSAKDKWDSAGFTVVDPTSGDTIPFTFTDYINGKYTLADITSTATGATAADATAILDYMAAEINWNSAGFTRESGGRQIAFTYAEFAAGTFTATDITGSVANPAPTGAAAAQAEAGALPTTLTISDNAFNNSLIPGTSDADKLAFLYNTANPNSGVTLDRSIFASATPANATKLTEMNNPEIQSNAMQVSDGDAANLSRTQDGYGFGYLSSYYVDEKGVLSGIYSNGITQQLFQIVMYDFTSPQNLRREGGNVYSQTLDSGDPKSGPAGVAGLGTITSNAIEQSNVDLATEFVLMITTQRGYQGNSKVVTTVDTMLESVINLKR